ncbi:MAG: hypothetical protein ABW123_12605, partial [Cystobacter sp.]
MQLRNMTLVVAALSLALAACPGGGREDLSCDSDATCLESELCHPQAKVCVQTCTAAADCPDSAKKCEAISGGNTQNICKCSTDALCQTDSSVADASTLSCDKTYSVCKTTGTGGGGGGGNSRPTPGAACTGSSQSTCASGLFCSNSKCESVPEATATCENFSKSLPNWNPSSSGPVIYSVTRASYEEGSSRCKSDAPNAFIVRARAYRPDSNWPDTRAGLSGFFYVTVDGTELDIVNQKL